jgi:putative tryptophan/tyrosine transport system substrate-binding protein
MKKFILLLVIIGLSIAYLLWQGFATESTQDDHTIKIGITQIISHPSLDEVRRGIEDGLKEIPHDIKISYQNAQGNMLIASQIAQKFAGDNVKMVFTISTPSSQSTLPIIKTKNIPMIFGAVTDPLAARLVKDMAHPHDATGVTDNISPHNQLKYMHEIYPSMKSIGVLYNPGEANSVAQAIKFKQAAQELGYAYYELNVTKATDASSAAASLIDYVDVIYIPTDNMIISVIESVVRVALTSNKPVFTSDIGSVSRGALAATGVDFYATGKRMAAMGTSILNGKKIEDISVYEPQETHLYLNQTTANKLNINFSDDILQRAEKIFN